MFSYFTKKFKFSGWSGQDFEIHLIFYGKKFIVSNSQEEMFDFMNLIFFS